jgi:hypothetical protein
VYSYVELLFGKTEVLKLCECVFFLFLPNPIGGLADEKSFFISYVFFIRFRFGGTFSAAVQVSVTENRRKHTPYYSVEPNGFPRLVYVKSCA